MKIAFLAPPFGQTGGPEITTTQLVDALVDAGVDVTLYAPADWKTKAKLVPTLDQSLWEMPNFLEQSKEIRINLVAASQFQIIAEQDKYDLIQLCSLRYAYAVTNSLHVPCVLTLNNRIRKDFFDLIKKTKAYTSAFTKKYQEEIGADFHVKRGMPLSHIKPNYEKGSGLITVGRLTEQKGIHTAIEIAQKAGKKLTIIGRIGETPDRQAYFEQKIKPFVDGENVILIEKCSNEEVLKLMAASEALLFPITKEEAFGRVQLEALACGTPVIGTKIDPLPEVLCDEQIAYLSDNVAELAEAAKNTERFDRKKCRKFVEDNHDISKEAQGYIEIYKKILGV